jgi:hypothetical protein
MAKPLATAFSPLSTPLLNRVSIAG